MAENLGQDNKVTWKDIYDVVLGVNEKIDKLNGEITDLKIKVALVSAAVALIVSLATKFLP